jgi:hypothetical protein
MDMVEATHKTIRLSDDPVIRQLQFKLGELAATFGTTPNPTQIVEEYKQAVSQLYQLGWDGIIPFDCELPDPYMPEEYLRRNPEAAIPIKNEDWLSAPPPAQSEAAKTPGEYISLQIYEDGRVYKPLIIQLQDQVIIGRDDIANADPSFNKNNPVLVNSVSRRHAKLSREHGQILITDLESTKGTALNSMPLVSGQRYRVIASDRITLGNVTCMVGFPEGRITTQPQPQKQKRQHQEKTGQLSDTLRSPR